jgi:Fe-S-cluster containining protein
MNIHFKCTQCGNCCRDSKVPLTVAEAIAWLNRGHQVQLICEASPWPEGLADADSKAAQFKRRSFAAMSGSMAMRVVVILAANTAGACPNLLADMRCGIYGERPLVCRIYPSEINPLIALNPREKACPPEAWSAGLPILQRDGVTLSPAVRQDIASSRYADAADVGVKIRLCAALNVSDAAMVHEAVLVYSPPSDTLLSALAGAMAAEDGRNSSPQWRFVSDRAETIGTLSAHGGVAQNVRDADAVTYQYLRFERKALFGPYADLLSRSEQ